MSMGWYVQRVSTHRPPDMGPEGGGVPCPLGHGTWDATGYGWQTGGTCPFLLGSLSTSHI